MNVARFQRVPIFAGKRHNKGEGPCLSGTEDFIFSNIFYTMRNFIEPIRQHGARPECEIYVVAMVNKLAYLIKTGRIDTPLAYLQIVLGIKDRIRSATERCRPRS